jgi:ABC-2 type transport system ATP-binding protein
VLHNGKVELQGSLTDLKHRCGGEYLLETENRQDAEMLLRRFPTLREQGEQLLFKEELLSALLVFLAEQKISPIRLERQEPSLESLFMEVVEQ